MTKKHKVDVSRDEQAAGQQEPPVVEDRAAEQGRDTAQVAEGKTATDDEEENVESLKQALEEASAQAAENWEKFVRVQAEMDNIAKRARRDLENAHKFALEKFINELLPVWDSLEMGLGHADGENIDPEKLKEGHELTLRMLAQVMEKFNVEQVDPLGEAFNPELHEAMTMQPSDEIEPNCVLAVIQKGYRLNDRLIRPARVVVAKAMQE